MEICVETAGRVLCAPLGAPTDVALHSRAGKEWFAVEPGVYRLLVWECTPPPPAEAPAVLAGPVNNTVPGCLVFRVAATGSGPTRLHAYTYLEYVAASPAAQGNDNAAELCQYSRAIPVDLPGVVVKIRGPGALQKVAPKTFAEALEIDLPGPPQAVAECRREKPLGMMYSIVIKEGQKWRTNQGLSIFGRVELAPAVVDEWISRAQIPPDADRRVALQKLVSPLRYVSRYQGEVRNAWQNLLVAHAVTGQQVEGDCEDSALAAYTVLSNIAPGQRLPPSLRGIDWSRARPFLCAGWFCRTPDSREAHMWAGVCDGEAWWFVESVTMGGYERLVDESYIAVRVFFEDRAGWVTDKQGQLFPRCAPGSALSVLYDDRPILAKPGATIDYPGLTMPTVTTISTSLFTAAGQSPAAPAATADLALARPPAEADWVAAPPLRRA